MVVEDDRLIFAAEDVENFFFFGDAGHRLIDDGKLVERFGGGVELADAAVDEDQAGEGLVLGLQAAVAAFDRFLHAGKIVAQNSRRFFGAFGHGFTANDEFAVIGFFHFAGFPDDHGRDGFGALNV